MRGVKNRIVILFVLAIGLMGWPFAAWAQGCYISGHGDYICDRAYQAPARSAPTPPAQSYRPIYNDKRDAAARYWEALEKARQAEAERIRQESEARRAAARVQGAAPPAPSVAGACTFVAGGNGSSSVSGRSYYVSPNGSGTACTASNPCSVQQAVNNAGPGDEVVFKNGNYEMQFQTKRDGAAGKPITFRAENPHGARFYMGPLKRGQSRSSQRVCLIRNSHITFRDMVCDGTYARAVAQIDNGGKGRRHLTGVLFENNKLLNGGGSSLHLGHGDKYIVRFNYIESLNMPLDTGWGETLYFGSSKPNGSNELRNVEFYGNIVRGGKENILDLKPSSVGLNVHHNIFEMGNQVAPAGVSNGPHSKGVFHGRNGMFIHIGGTGHTFSNNIIRNASAPWGNIIGLHSGKATVANNVSYGFDNVLNVIGNNNNPTPGGGVSTVTGNNFCGLRGVQRPISTRAQKGVDNGDYKLSNNNLNAPQAICNSEAQRILNEMKNLPSGGGAWQCAGSG